ncbi:hypothetical protein GCM10023156_65400 [Novipirellula rosea]|uniref:Uncharacterized protein n=1 Tax=Novipirellula rosea TaxID=1031540 RepID=A0ABP8NUA7_9BACT
MFDCGFVDVEPQIGFAMLLIGAVTSKTLRRQHGTDISIERDFIVGVQTGGSTNDAANQSKQDAVNKVGGGVGLHGCIIVEAIRFVAC